MGMQFTYNPGPRVQYRGLIGGALRAALCGVLLCLGAWSGVGAGPDPEDRPARAVETTSAERDTAHVAGLAASETRALGAPEIESTPLSGPAERRRGAVTEGVQTMVVLGGVVAVILGMAMGLRLLAKRHGGLMAACGPGGKSPSGVLSVLGRYPIARGQTLLLLQFDRRVLLVGQTTGRGGARMATLAELSDANDVASVLVKTRDESGESVARKFREIVDKMSEPAAAPERAVTVVAPIERADWFEKTGSKRARAEEATTARPIKAARASEQTHRAGRGPRMDGAAALRSRLEAMRAGGGR